MKLLNKPFPCFITTDNAHEKWPRFQDGKITSNIGGTAKMNTFPFYLHHRHRCLW